MHRDWDIWDTQTPPPQIHPYEWPQLCQFVLCFQVNHYMTNEEDKEKLYTILSKYQK